MLILKVTNLVLISLSAVLVPTWTYYEGVVNHLMDERKPLYYLLLVWGGSALLVLLKGIDIRRTITGGLRPKLEFKTKPYALCMIIYCCGFTLHALQAATPEFDVDHLNMPFYLPFLFLPLHFLLTAWILFFKGESPADRGLYLVLLFHALNGAVFNTEFFLIFAFTAVTVVETLIENRGKWSRPPLFMGLPLALFLILATVSTLEGMNPVKATQALTHTGVAAAVLLLVASRPRTADFYWKLIGFTLLGALLVVAAALLLLLSVGSLLGPIPVLTTRLTIFYQHPNFLAPYLAMIALLGLTILYRHRLRRSGPCMLLFVPLVLAALLLTDSRAGFLGFGAGLAILLTLTAPVRALLDRAMHPLRKLGRRVLVPAGAVMLAGIICLTALFSDPIVSRLEQSTRIRRAMDYRLDAWANSVEVIKDHPLLGIGPDTFVSVKKFPPGSKFAHEDKAPHPHNVLLYIAQSCGVPALAVFLILLCGYVHASVVIIRRIDDASLRTLTIGCVSAATALLVCGMLDLGLALVTLFPGPVWLFMGITASVYSSRFATKKRDFLLEGTKAMIPAAAVVVALVFGAFLPLGARILLKRAYLTEQFVGREEGMRVVKGALDADPLLNQAREFLLRRYISLGAYSEAYHLLEEASALEPENPELYMNMGNVLSMSGELDRTAEAYRKAVEIDHGSINLPRYFARLVTTEAEAGWKDKAATHLKEAIRRDIKVINLIRWKVRPHTSGRDDQFLEIGFNSEILRLEDVLDEIHGELEASRNENKPQDRFDWFALFQAYDNALVFNRALEVLQDIEDIFGEKEAAAVKALRAIVEKKRENLEQSKDLLDLAEQLTDESNPGAAFYYQTRRSEALILEGRYDEAIAQLEETLRNKHDYLNYRYSFEVALDNLLRALDAKQIEGDKIEPLRMRLFFHGDKTARLPVLVDLASAYRAAGEAREAERTVLEALDLAAVVFKKVDQLEEPLFRDPIRRAAYLLAGLYEDEGLQPVARLRRAWHATDFFSSNPARYLFKYDFLIRCGLPDPAMRVLDLSLMDSRESLLLHEFRVECAQMLDDPDTLWIAADEVSKAYQWKKIDLEARCQGLFATVVEDRENLPLILELIRLLTWRFKLDHGLNIVREALKIHSRESELHWLAARLHRLLGDPESARSSLERALETDPGYFMAAIALANLEAHMAKAPARREGP